MLLLLRGNIELELFTWFVVLTNSSYHRFASSTYMQYYNWHNRVIIGEEEFMVASSSALLYKLTILAQFLKSRFLLTSLQWT